MRIGRAIGPFLARLDGHDLGGTHSAGGGGGGSPVTVVSGQVMRGWEACWSIRQEGGERGKTGTYWVLVVVVVRVVRVDQRTAEMHGDIAIDPTK